MSKNIPDPHQDVNTHPPFNEYVGWIRNIAPKSMPAQVASEWGISVESFLIFAKFRKIELKPNVNLNDICEQINIEKHQCMNLLKELVDMEYIQESEGKYSLNEVSNDE